MTPKSTNAASRVRATPVARRAAVKLPQPPHRAYICHWPPITHSSSRILALLRLTASSMTVRAFPLPLGLCPSTTLKFWLDWARPHPSSTTPLRTAARLIIRLGEMALLPVPTHATPPLQIVRKVLTNSNNNKICLTARQEICQPGRRQVSRNSRRCGSNT